MRTSWKPVSLICGLLLLASCGTTSTTIGGSVNPPSKATNPATPPISTPAGTVSAANGAGIVISLDHAVYAPNASIHVSVKNGLATAIYGLDTQAGCSILGLQMQSNGTWQGSNAAACPLRRVAAPVRIASGATYTTVIHAGAIQPGTFPVGVYRFTLAYSTSPNAVPSIDGTTIAYSPTFQVQG
jgi:hypothetical protein